MVLSVVLNRFVFTVFFAACLAASTGHAQEQAAQSAVADPLAQTQNTQAPPGVNAAAQPIPTAAETQGNVQTTTQTTTTATQTVGEDAAVTGTLPAETTQTTTTTTTNSSAIAPPGPGGAPMVDGQIPPISAELLALTPEEQAEMALQNAREQAFKGSVQSAMPLEPEEIDTVIRRYEDTSKAIEQPFSGEAPKPEVRVETLSLEPSAAPPIVRLAPGHVTSLTMLDATGQPWPVADVSWGGDFEITAPEEGGHIIRISPLGGYKVGNMSLRLKDLTTPVTFTLQTQPDIVDYRFDARLPVPGPNALSPVIDTNFSSVAGNGALMTVLDGVPPKGTQQMGVSGVDGRTTAYKIGNEIYVRTPLSMLSPAWTEQAASADGMRVYVIPETPVLLLSDQGRMVRANLEASPSVTTIADDRTGGSGS